MTRSRPRNANTTMSTIELIFPDGTKREYPAGTTGYEVAAAISPSLAKRTVLARDERRERHLVGPKGEEDAALIIGHAGRAAVA